MSNAHDKAYKQNKRKDNHEIPVAAAIQNREIPLAVAVQDNVVSYPWIFQRDLERY